MMSNSELDVEAILEGIMRHPQETAAGASTADRFLLDQEAGASEEDGLEVFEAACRAVAPEKGDSPDDEAGPSDEA